MPAASAWEPRLLKPAAELAERVLLPADPHSALAVAQSVLTRPRIFNHHHGLWGYSGGAADGEPMSVQATGLGATSAAAVVEELAGLGARTLVRLGLGRALDPELPTGAIVCVSEARGGDGVSRAMGARGSLPPDRALAERLRAEAGAGTTGAVVSSDLFYDPRRDWAERWRQAGCLAVDLEGAAVAWVASTHGIAAAGLVGVTESGERRLDRDETKALVVELGQLAAAALRR